MRTARVLSLSFLPWFLSWICRTIRLAIASHGKAWITDGRRRQMAASEGRQRKIKNPYAARRRARGVVVTSHAHLPWEKTSPARGWRLAPVRAGQRVGSRTSLRRRGRVEERAKRSTWSERRRPEGCRERGRRCALAARRRPSAAETGTATATAELRRPGCNKRPRRANMSSEPNSRLVARLDLCVANRADVAGTGE